MESGRGEGRAHGEAEQEAMLPAAEGVPPGKGEVPDQVNATPDENDVGQSSIAQDQEVETDVIETG